MKYSLTKWATNKMFCTMKDWNWRKSDTTTDVKKLSRALTRTDHSVIIVMFPLRRTGVFSRLYITTDKEKESYNFTQDCRLSSKVIRDKDKATHHITWKPQHVAIQMSLQKIIFMKNSSDCTERTVEGFASINFKNIVWDLLGMTVVSLAARHDLWMCVCTACTQLRPTSASL